MDELWGQSLLPLDTGPDGSGIPKSPAYLKSMSFGFRSYAADGRPQAIFICDKPYHGDDPPSRIITSSGFEDTDTFGAANCARRYTFNPYPLVDIDSPCYVYFAYPTDAVVGDAQCQPISCAWGNVYPGGAGILPTGALEPEVTLQFQAVFTDDETDEQ